MKTQILDEMPSRAIRETPVDWDKAKRDVMKHPGKWVLMADNVAPSVMRQLKLGKNPRFRGEELKQFEFRVKRPEDADYPPRRSDLWGRYTA